MTAGGNGSLHLWKYKYPGQRSKEGKNKQPEGVIGECIELNRSTLATQPISSFQWSPDKTYVAPGCR